MRQLHITISISTGALMWGQHTLQGQQVLFKQPICTRSTQVPAQRLSGSDDQAQIFDRLENLNLDPLAKNIDSTLGHTTKIQQIAPDTVFRYGKTPFKLLSTGYVTLQYACPQTIQVKPFSVSPILYVVLHLTFIQRYDEHRKKRDQDVLDMYLKRWVVTVLGYSTAVRTNLQ